MKGETLLPGSRENLVEPVGNIPTRVAAVDKSHSNKLVMFLWLFVSRMCDNSEIYSFIQ